MYPAEEFSFPKKWGTFRPKFIIALVAILTFLGVVVGYFEISQSRKGIMNLLREEAQTVTEALAISAENAVQSYAEVESLIESQLFKLGLVVIQLQKEKALTQKRFEKIMTQSGVAKAFCVNSKMNLQDYVFPADAMAHFAPESVVQFLTPLFKDTVNSTSGLVEDWDGKIHYAVGVKYTTDTAWVLCAAPNLLLDYRKRAGIGRLIQNLGENEEIAYIVLQDDEGLISATKNITSISSLASDSLLQQVFLNSRSFSRIQDFEGEEVFEVARPFTINGEIFGLIRVALKMDVANQAVTRTIQRAVVIILGFIVLGVILFNFLMTYQNYNLLTEAYSKIQTYTGNILENMADAVVAVNRSGRITLFNRAAEKLFGRTSKNVIGHSCQDIIGEQTSLLDRTLSTGQEVRDQEVEYQLENDQATLSVTTNLLRDHQDEIDSAVAVIKDLTEKKAWEQRLRRQEKLTAMGELASGVAHEIRNPLNAISIIAQRFGWEFKPTENEQEYRDLANSIVSETQRVSSIIERFLEFARPPVLNLQRHDLPEVLRNVFTVVESEAKEQGVALKLDGSESVELKLDRNQMQQVFLNLLQNSLQATPAGGTIEVKISRDGADAMVEVRDTGKGIPPEHLNRIFDLYFTTKENGTGMGLSICHRIVTEHAGRIEVSSEEGKGTTFKIYLPV